MRKFIAVATVLSLVGFLVVPGALAQSGTTPERSIETTPSSPTEKTPSTSPGMKEGQMPTTSLGTSSEVSTSTLIGANVKNPQGETLGSIKELLIDPQEAKIMSAVVSVGGILGIGAKTVAIPWNEMKPQSDGKEIIVAMGKEEIQNAPEWKKVDEAKQPVMREPTTPPPSARPGALGR
jgi:sporulation protein YlmC with PRC-barrel domain